MTYNVTAGGVFTLIENDTVRSVLQNISAILGTARGTVPMYREFGIDASVLDKPMPVAETLIAADVRETVERFEPRAKVTDVRLEVNASGKIKIVCEVEIT